MRRRTPLTMQFGLALALASLSACGGSSTPTVINAFTPQNFLITSLNVNEIMPTAVVNGPYAFGFQTNLGQPGVSAVAPISFITVSGVPPGMSMEPDGVLVGTPSTAGRYFVSIQAHDSSQVPQTAIGTFELNVDNPADSLTQVGRTALTGQGQNGGITVGTATATKIGYAYVGTRGSAGDCPATGVKIVDLSQISNPNLVATAGAVPGASQQEPTVATGISSPQFHSGGKGDLLAVTEQPCNPVVATSSQEGVKFFDVSDPTHPIALGFWNSGYSGVSDAALLPIPGPTNAVGQINHALDKIYALVGVPESESQGGEGDFRVLDITDPTQPREIANWGILAATGVALPQMVQGQDQRVFLDSITLSSDLKTAYLSYWDGGVAFLDVSDPTVIRSSNSAIFVNRITYPITSVATTTTPSSPEGNSHLALPVDNNTEMLVVDDVCASAMAPSASNPSQMTPANPAVAVVCGSKNDVTLDASHGWGFVRSFDMPSSSTWQQENFYAAGAAESDPAPDNGIYTAHDLAWNGDANHPHAYVAWMSAGIVDLDVQSVSPPTLLASFVPPDTPDPNGATPGVDNPAKAMVYGVAAYHANGNNYVLASDINSGLYIVQEVPNSSLLILTTSLPDPNTGVPYTAQITAVNGAQGNSGISYAIQTGSLPLPSGLQMDSDGNITGTAAVAGSTTVTFVARDVEGDAVQQTIPMTVDGNLAVIPQTPPLATQSEPMSVTLAGANGTPPYTWSVVNSTLPLGLSLNATTGTVSGTPLSAGTTVTTFRITDSTNPVKTATLPITFTVAPLTISPDPLPDGDVGAEYVATVKMENGAGPFTPIIVAGALPPGLSATSGTSPEISWQVTGTPTTPGVYPFTARVTDNDGAVATQSFTIVINPFEITPAVLPSGVEGQGYTVTLTPQGGASPYLAHLVVGSLPPGLSLSFQGVISGVPSAGSAGSYTFTVQQTDANGLVSQQTYTIVIFTGNVFSITTTGLPPAQIGQSYTQTLQANFGTPQYTFTLTGGVLPQGLILNPNGTLSGVPGTNTQGNYQLTLKATDANGQITFGHLTLTVLPAQSPK